jgi:hypothetical protein
VAAESGSRSVIRITFGVLLVTARSSNDLAF